MFQRKANETADDKAANTRKPLRPVDVDRPYTVATPERAPRMDIPGSHGPSHGHGYGTGSWAQPSSGAPADEGRRLTVGREISLTGNISACNHLVVEGVVEAELRGGQRVDITETGLFKGIVEIQDADIAGRFEGDLTVRGRLTVRATGQIVGSLRYGQIEVHAGARIEGTLTVLEQAELPVSEPQQKADKKIPARGAQRPQPRQEEALFEEQQPDFQIEEVATKVA